MKDGIFEIDSFFIKFAEKNGKMTAVTDNPKRYTIEEYLEMEALARQKHHFINGQLIPMPGGTLKHNTIASNIITALNNLIRLHNLPYLVSNSDTKIWIPDIQTFYYPDAVVLFEHPDYFQGRKDVVMNPLLIVEVASGSTENHDRGQKFMDYALLPTFQEYLMVVQDKPLVRISRRSSGNLWHMESTEGMDEHIPLHSIGYAIAMSDIYYRTEHL